MVFTSWKKGEKVVATSPFSGEIFSYISSGAVVLDAGCGNGRIAKILRDHGCKTYGIDVNIDAINSVKDDPDLCGISFSVQDIVSTNFDSEFFDGIVVQGVLACVEKDDRFKLLCEMNRLLKKDGILSIVEFGIRQGREEKYKVDAQITGEYGTMIVRNPDGSEWFRSHNFSKEELDMLLEIAGFEIVTYSTWEGTTFHGNTHPGHQYIVRKRACPARGE
jgi:ubiquinone/menaquinone biosynthesis C-methylase UbiE